LVTIRHQWTGESFASSNAAVASSPSPAACKGVTAAVIPRSDAQVDPLVNQAFEPLVGCDLPACGIPLPEPVSGPGRAANVRSFGVSGPCRPMMEIDLSRASPLQSVPMPNPPARPTKAVTDPRPVESLIHVIRGQKVMLDSDLAALYQVTTGNLNLAVRRNESRFPSDFMFQLSKAEADSLLLQTARAKAGRGGRRTPPFAFTELGVAMLSSVLNSERAVQMNMIIMRAFVRIREILTSNKDIAARIEKLERGHERTASVIEILVEDIDELSREVKDMKALPPATKRKIGFVPGDD
jgi:hypothetical protein